VVGAGIECVSDYRKGRSRWASIIATMFAGSTELRLLLTIFDDRRQSKRALYAPDEYRLRKNVIVNAGVRHDHTTRLAQLTHDLPSICAARKDVAEAAVRPGVPSAKLFRVVLL
jgi:outer membrane receptor protein involved in Fe transport